MHRDQRNYRILLIEDNPGDRVLIEDYLKACFAFADLVLAGSFREARAQVQQADFDVILLDLTLPDGAGQSLIEKVLLLAKNVPVIVLTGYNDLSFAIHSMGLGISDYLLKDELEESVLYKSLRYSMERKKYLLELQDSEKRYSDLFQLSPQPAWCIDPQTQRFLEVNAAAVSHYGYSQEDFLTMHLSDLCYKEASVDLQPTRDSDFNLEGLSCHQTKEGKIIEVELKSCFIHRQGKWLCLMLVNDITAQRAHLRHMATQNQKLQEIVWRQSHGLRAPLARLQGIVQLLQISGEDFFKVQEKDKLLLAIQSAAEELDQELCQLVKKTESARIRLSRLSSPNVYN